LTKDLEELGDEDLEPREDNRVNELLNEYKIPQTRERLPELRDQESNSQDPAIEINPNPRGTNVWKELYDRYKEIEDNK
jgi:hypothetical protein